MVELKEDQKKKIKLWLRSGGEPGERFRCPACRNGGLMEPNSVIALSDGDLRVVPLTCNSCAHVTFLNAQMLDI